ncbi:cupin domain-containing protein [Patescibacteria group bacterium]|nr:cupin domain-containing protein [Patescibacteria group bacterium]
MSIKNIHKLKGIFFKIVDETPLSQVGVMTISPGKDSGPEEVHSGDQFVYIIEGEAEVEINKEKAIMKTGDAVIIRSGQQHHIYNKSDSELFFLTVYTPPQY